MNPFPLNSHIQGNNELHRDVLAYCLVIIHSLNACILHGLEAELISIAFDFVELLQSTDLLI